MGIVRIKPMSMLTAGDLRAMADAVEAHASEILEEPALAVVLREEGDLAARRDMLGFQAGHEICSGNCAALRDLADIIEIRHYGDSSETLADLDAVEEMDLLDSLGLETLDDLDEADLVAARTAFATAVYGDAVRFALLLCGVAIADEED